MPKRSKFKGEAKAIAKIEASAKASYQRKKIITEIIPPDVSRAKASAWLTLISPITEWAGLKGDALKYRRHQLRIQQEETLLKIGLAVSEKLKGRKVIGSVPTKILVPLLEKASLEEPSDSTMIELWSNLLVSAGFEASVPPRYVHIVGELNSRQANLFMEIVTKGQDLEERDLADPVFLLRQRDIEDRLDRLLKRKRLTANDVYVEFMDDLEGPCVALTDLWVNTTRGKHWLIPPSENKFGDIGAQTDIQILSSLGLFDEIRVHRRHEHLGLTDITILYFLLTEMGLDFFQAVTGKST